MSEIEITLLENKATTQRIEGYQVNAVVNRHGYQVVAGENNATEIAVLYPPQYKNQLRYVYMKNALGEYTVIQFETSEQQSISSRVERLREIIQPAKPNKNKGTFTKQVREGEDRLTFTLPDSMTVAGATWLVFYAMANDGDPDADPVIKATKTVWQPVHVPILATSVDYKKVAMSSPDILEEAIKAIEAVRKLLQKPDVVEDGGEIDVSIDKDKGNFVFRNIRGADGAKGDTGRDGVGAVYAKRGLTAQEEHGKFMTYDVVNYMPSVGDMFVYTIPDTPIFETVLFLDRVVELKDDGFVFESGQEFIVRRDGISTHFTKKELSSEFNAGESLHLPIDEYFHLDGNSYKLEDTVFVWSKSSWYMYMCQRYEEAKVTVWLTYLDAKIDFGGVMVEQPGGPLYNHNVECSVDFEFGGPEPVYGYWILVDKLLLNFQNHRSEPYNLNSLILETFSFNCKVELFIYYSGETLGYQDIQVTNIDGKFIATIKEFLGFPNSVVNLNFTVTERDMTVKKDDVSFIRQRARTRN